MNRPALSDEKVSDLVARLQRHPQLGEHMAAVLDAAENRAGPLHTGDEAEDATVERLRPLGRWALGQWAEQRHTAVSISFASVIIPPPRPTQPTAKPSSLRSPLAITSASSPRCASAKNPQTSRTTTPPRAPRFAIWAIAPINSTMPAPSRSICHRLRRHRQAATATSSMPASRKPAPSGSKPSSTASAKSALSAQNSTRETLGPASDLTSSYTPWDVPPSESRPRIITIITPTAPLSSATGNSPPRTQPARHVLLLRPLHRSRRERARVHANAFHRPCAGTNGRKTTT